MKVFISWSGERSKALASALKDYLPLVVQAVDPWFSPDDIDKGSRWLGDLTDQLQKQSVAIVCITPESANSSWLLFEVGALSKALDVSWVCPVLFGIEPTDIMGPLTQFQATKITKEDIRKLLGTLNKRAAQQLKDTQIDSLHDALWPTFQKRVDAIPKLLEGTAPAHRSQTDMLTELLERVRGLERRLTEPTHKAVSLESILARSTPSQWHEDKTSSGTLSLQHQITRFRTLAAAMATEVETLESEILKNPNKSHSSSDKLAQDLDRARNKLNQYLMEVDRLEAKFKRARG